MDSQRTNQTILALLPFLKGILRQRGLGNSVVLVYPDFYTVFVKFCYHTLLTKMKKCGPENSYSYVAF